MKLKQCIEAMELLKKQGKVRYWGLSLNTFHPEEEAEYFIKNNFGSGFQLVFNLINQRALAVMEEAGKRDMELLFACLCNSGCLQENFLTKKNSQKMTIEISGLQKR